MLSFANVLWPFRFRASESTGHIPVVYCNASSHASVSGMKQLPSESSISVSDESDCDLSESLHRSLPLLWHLGVINLNSIEQNISLYDFRGQTPEGCELCELCLLAVHRLLCHVQLYLSTKRIKQYLHLSTAGFHKLKPISKLREQQGGHTFMKSSNDTCVKLNQSI